MIFKLLPNVRLRWRDVWLGAVTTSLLYAGKVCHRLLSGNEQRCFQLWGGQVRRNRPGLDLLLRLHPLLRRGNHEKITRASSVPASCRIAAPCSSMICSGPELGLTSATIEAASIPPSVPPLDETSRPA